MTSSKVEVEPAPPLPLFDPARGELPPLDAIEVYLEPPPSLSLLHGEAVATGEYTHWIPHLEAAWAAGQVAALDALLRNVQIKVGQHYDRPGQASVGKYLFGRLSITHVPHLCVPGTEPFTQMHDHFYIAPTAIPDEPRCMSMAGTSLLSPWDAGKPWPLDLFALRAGTASLLDAMYQIAIQQELTARIGTVWIPGRRGVPSAIAGCEDVVGEFPRIMCPGLPRHRARPPRTRAELLDLALAAEPDASEERRWELRNGPLPDPDRPGERIIIRDLTDPPPPNRDDFY